MAASRLCQVRYCEAISSWTVTLREKSWRLCGEHVWTFVRRLADTAPPRTVVGVLSDGAGVRPIQGAATPSPTAH